ncbi:efflux transporter outer membrane subunit [Saccharicrinis aurantiacus]|uniref:efflux transporter outer membrane subunit n=1 Tax=Saccharicrinis aurantiacus TaxID=1849719 RepID=UPI00094FB281|nr:efflux transporter outer membrane subunit [Saccharicrinis aurantiacus]
MKLLYIISFALFIVTGCKVGKEYQAPEMDIPDAITTVQANDSASLADLKWYLLFKDTILVNMIHTALENNQDMKIAAARIRQTMALKRIAAAPMFPEVSVFGEKYQENIDYSGTSDINRLRAELSWELDLWGNIRWGKEAAMAEYLKTTEAQRSVKMSLIANVAQTYFELFASKRELQIIKETGRARQEGVDLAKLRFEGGLTSETSLRQAEVEYAKTMTLIPKVERTIVLKQNQLALLLGKMPTVYDIEVDITENIIQDSIPVGMPSYLLERRPDVRMAEQTLIAANADVGVSLTNLFPKITLTAQYGMQSKDLSDLLTNPYSYFAGDILAPIFAAGANKARLKASRAAFEQQYFEYEKTVLGAFQETNNSITTFYKAKEVRALMKELENSSRTYLELANLQYINGVINYLDVLDAQRLLFDAEVSLNDAYLDEMTSYILLYKALGGGW